MAIVLCKFGEQVHAWKEMNLLNERLRFKTHLGGSISALTNIHRLQDKVCNY